MNKLLNSRFALVKLFVLAKSPKAVLAVVLSLFHFPSPASVDYAVVSAARPVDETRDEFERRTSRVYFYGGYNLHFLQAPIDNPLHVRVGNNAGGPGAALGFRFADYARMEFAYEGLDDRVEAAAEKIMLRGHGGFANFIFDAEAPPEYALFKTSPITPFAGLGIGAVLSDSGYLADRVMAAYNLIAGVSVRVNRTLALQVSYKYIAGIGGNLMGAAYNPYSHNIGGGLRLDF